MLKSSKEFIRENKILFWFLFLLLIIRIFIFFYHFNYPVIDQHSFRQTQNLMTIRNYCREGINLFLPKLDIFGEPGYVVLEFPLYQGIVAGLSKLFNCRIVAFGRIVSILSTVLSAWFLFLISRKYFNFWIAIFALIFFLFTPTTIFYSRSVMLEPFAVMLTLVMFYCYLKWMDDESFSFWALAVVFGSLSFLLKPMYALVVFFPIVYYQLQNKDVNKLFYFDFVMAIGIPVIATFLWFIYGNFINNLFPNSFMLSGRQLYRWYFGTISQRLNTYFYLHIAARSGVFIFGILGIIPFVLAFKKWNTIPKIFYIWLFSSVLYIFIFLNLNYVHDYYQYPLIPIFSIFQAVGFIQIMELLENRKINKDLLMIGILVVMLSGNICISMDRFKPKDYSLYEAAKIVERIIPKRSKVIFVSDFNGPQYHYHSDTKGYMMAMTNLKIESLMFKIYKDKIKYLVFIGEIPNYLKYSLKEFNLRYKTPLTLFNEKGKFAARGLFIYKYHNNFNK